MKFDGGVQAARTRIDASHCFWERGKTRDDSKVEWLCVATLCVRVSDDVAADTRDVMGKKILWLLLTLHSHWHWLAPPTGTPG
jgi:hypothetical protein